MAVCVILTTHPKAPRYEQVRESETSQQLAELLLSLNTPSCPHDTILFHTTTVPLLPPAGSLLHPQSYAAGS